MRWARGGPCRSLMKAYERYGFVSDTHQLWTGGFEPACTLNQLALTVVQGSFKMSGTTVSDPGRI